MGISNHMVFGYGRPKNKQEVEEQILLLQQQGCQTILMERVGEGKIRDGQLKKMIDQLRTSDKIIVPSIYVFPMTLLKLIDFFSGLQSEGIEVICLREDIKNDPLYQVLNSYHTRSRAERATASLPKGKGALEKRGRKPGMTQEVYELSLAIVELKRQGNTIADIKEQLGIKSTRMIYDAFKIHGVETRPKRSKMSKN